MKNIRFACFTALCAKGQGLPLGRKLSQFFFFFVWAGTLWALVTSPKGPGKLKFSLGNLVKGNTIFYS
jgi:hypothetical protein